jgi:hypothetical protein
MADEPFRKLDWDELGIVRPANGPVPKAVVREAVRVAIQPHVKALVEAQVAQAVGIKYLMARDADGKFKRVVSETPEDLDALIADGGTILEVWTKDPSTPAFTDLMNRAIDKPKEQEVEVKITGSDELLARLDAWKMAHRVLEREDEEGAVH